jgi:hypothetical protein
MKAIFCGSKSEIVKNPSFLGADSMNQVFWGRFDESGGRHPRRLSTQTWKQKFEKKSLKKKNVFIAK